MSHPEILWGTLGRIRARVGTAPAPTEDTGVTVLVLAPGSTGSVDVAGGAPATRETDLLRPDATVKGPDALCLAGGSAPGLAAADGVLQILQKAGRGFRAGGVRVPIVSAAAIFDGGARSLHAPGAAEGALATRRALDGPDRGYVPEGQEGVGRSAGVGKLLGPEHEMPAGQAAGTLDLPGLGTVSALVVVNAFGSIRREDGTILAGPRGPRGQPLATRDLLIRDDQDMSLPEAGQATTLAIVLTDAPLSKAALYRVARMGHDGLARAIDPLHTPADGDTVFAVSVPKGSPDRVDGQSDAHPDAVLTRVGSVAALLLEESVRRAVLLAQEPRMPGDS